MWAQHAGSAVGDGWTPWRGAPTTQTTEHAPAGHPASGWSWSWAECPQAGLSAPSATGGSARGLSGAAVPVGPGRTSPRSLSLEFRVSLSPVPGAWGAGPHSAPGPQCFHAFTCLASLHRPTCRGPSCHLPRLGGHPGVLSGGRLQRTPCPRPVPSPGASVPVDTVVPSAPAGGFQERRRLMA